MDILNPPQSYINWRCATHNWERSSDSTPEEFKRIRNKFYAEFPDTEDEIIRFCNWLINARNEGSLPIERFEIRESDGKLHGRVVSGMIYDIEYWRDKGQVKRRKIYTEDQGQFSRQTEMT